MVTAAENTDAFQTCPKSVNGKDAGIEVFECVMKDASAECKWFKGSQEINSANFRWRTSFRIRLLMTISASWNTKPSPMVPTENSSSRTSADKMLVNTVPSLVNPKSLSNLPSVLNQHPVQLLQVNISFYTNGVFTSWMNFWRHHDVFIMTLFLAFCKLMSH